MPAFVLCSEWTIKTSVILDGDPFLGTKNHKFYPKVCCISEPGNFERHLYNVLDDWSHVAYLASRCG